VHRLLPKTHFIFLFTLNGADNFFKSIFSNSQTVNDEKQKQHITYESFIDIARQMVKEKSKDYKDYETVRGCKLRGSFDGKILFLHYIYVPEKLRNKGLLRNFLQQIDTLSINQLVILGVQSDVLDSYLQRFVSVNTGAKFKCCGGDYVLDSSFVHSGQPS